MTTEQTEVTTRDIATLLALETYQGMTDEEIQSIIDYKMRYAFDAGASSAAAAATTEAMNEMLERNDRLMRSMSDVVESLVSYRPLLEVEEEDGNS